MLTFSSKYATMLPTYQPRNCGVLEDKTQSCWEKVTHANKGTGHGDESAPVLHHLPAVGAGIQGQRAGASHPQTTELPAGGLPPILPPGPQKVASFFLRKAQKKLHNSTNNSPLRRLAFGGSIFLSYACVRITFTINYQQPVHI